MSRYKLNYVFNNKKKNEMESRGSGIEGEEVYGKGYSV